MNAAAITRAANWLRSKAEKHAQENSDGRLWQCMEELRGERWMKDNGRRLP